MRGQGVEQLTTPQSDVICTGSKLCEFTIHTVWTNGRRCRAFCWTSAELTTKSRGGTPEGK